MLEMRIFSKTSLINFFESAGFTDIVFHKIDDDMKKYGIFWANNDICENSLIITAKK